MCETIESLLEEYGKMRWEEGWAEGNKEMLLSLANDGLLAVEQAAGKLGVSEEEFRAMLKDAQQNGLT